MSTWKVKNPNPLRCVASVHNDFGVSFHQCYHKPKKDSEFCGIHSPEAEDRRKAKSRAYWQAKSERWNTPAKELDHLRAVNTMLLGALEDEVQGLLSEVIERLDGTHYQDERQMLVHISAKLNDAIEQARED